MVFPEGFALPPLGYSLALAVALVVVLLGIIRDDPAVTPWTIMAFVPWMAAGGALHVLTVQEIVTEPLAHLLGTPAVYVFTAIVGGASWLLARRMPLDDVVSRPIPTIVGVLGCVALAVPTVAILATGLEHGTLSPGWPAVALVVSVVLSAIVWVATARVLPEVVSTTRVVGFVLVFAHVLDAISTTVGIDILGGVERSPLPRYIMDAAGMLPTAGVIGTGWAFVVVKIAISVGLLWLFAPFVRESPRQAYLLLGALAAVGLGPGVHNLLLFTIAG